MKQVKRFMAVWLSLLVVASVLTAAPAGAETPQPVDIDAAEEVEGVLAEAQAEVEAMSLEQATLLPEDDAVDAVVNDALLTDPVALVDPLPLVEQPDVTIENNEVVLASVDDGISPVVTMHRIARGVKRSDVDDDGRRVKVEDSIVLEATEGSLRILEVIDSRSDAHRFTYRFEVDGQKANLEQNEQGQVVISTQDGEVTEDSGITYHGVVDPAWAIDANGDDVNVSFEVVGNGKQLKMKVDRQSRDAYPITADPKWRLNTGIISCGWTSCTWTHEAVSTSDWFWMFNSNTGTAFTTTFVTMVCGVLAWLATVNVVVGGLITVGCAVLVASQQRHYNNHVTQAYNRTPDGCVTTKIGGWGGYTVGNVKRGGDCVYRG